MRSFKSLADLSQLPATDPAYAVVKRLIETCILPYDTPARPYRPDDEGWIVLIDEGDIGQPLTDVWEDLALLDVPWEGIMRVGEFFQAIFLANNEFGIVFAPDRWGGDRAPYLRPGSSTA